MRITEEFELLRNYCPMLLQKMAGSDDWKREIDHLERVVPTPDGFMRLIGVIESLLEEHQRCGQPTTTTRPLETLRHHFSIQDDYSVLKDSSQVLKIMDEILEGYSKHSGVGFPWGYSQLIGCVVTRSQHGITIGQQIVQEQLLHLLHRPSKLGTVAELAQKLNVSKSQIRKWKQEGVLEEKLQASRST